MSRKHTLPPMRAASNEAMRTAAGMLMAAGIVAFLLRAEHASAVHQRKTSDEELRESILERWIMPDCNLGKAPTAEGIQAWGRQSEAASLWIRWGIPGLGALALIGGILFFVETAFHSSRQFRDGADPG